MKSGHAERDAGRWQEQVESVCAGQGLHLTPLRRRVLTILSESSAPLGAYAIIDQLSRLEGKPIAPPTVYRTLDFFLDHGFVYKIESRNAITACCCCATSADEATKSKTWASIAYCRRPQRAPALPRTGKWSSSWGCAGIAPPRSKPNQPDRFRREAVIADRSYRESVAEFVRSSSDGAASTCSPTA
jgi:Fe2+ or Zn2+ uptake regulation protein